jgi:hypothetical protein
MSGKIFLIRGMPQNGKSTLAIKLANTDPNSTLIHLDNVFLEYNKDLQDIFHNDISDYVRSELFNINDFLKFLQAYIEHVNKQNNNLYIEGYVIERFPNEFLKFFDDEFKTLPIFIYVSRHADGGTNITMNFHVNYPYESDIITKISRLHL